jgi:hypothetical protein
MNSRFITHGGSVALAITLLLSAAPASAALDAESVACRDTIAKNMAKLYNTANKVIAGCHKARDKDPLLDATDCNDLAVADAEKLKYAGTLAKAVEAINGDCESLDEVFTAINDDGSDKEWYVSCPIDPCPGSDNYITDMDEVVACFQCVVEDAAESLATETMGSPSGLDSDAAKCHGAIAKGYGKFFKTAYKSETSCQGDNDDARNNAIEECVDFDPKAKVAGSLTKAEEGVRKACSVGMLPTLEGCAADTIDNLVACTEAAWVAAEDDSFIRTYFMENTAHCPTSVRTTILGGCSTTGSTSISDGCSVGAETGTVLSVGWKGLAHGVDVTDNYTIAVDVTCTGSVKGSCGTCTSTGISYDNPQYADFARCADDPWTKCDVPFGNDPDCDGGTGGACKYFLGPPLAVSAGGTPTCTLNIVNSDIVGGTGDPDAGTADFTVDLRALVHNGIGSQRPCPYCRNDPFPQDGNTSGGKCSGGSNNGGICDDDDDCELGNCVGEFGSCFGGPRDGQPCDVQGYDLSFANVDHLDQPTSGNSLDCPPTSGANISGSGLAITLPLTTGVSVKDAVDPCESPNGSLSCFCGICSLAQTTSCNSDADCVGMGVCAAGGALAGVARLPNNCSDGVCVPETSDRGTCSNGAGDVDSYCEGLLFANGKGVLSCGTDGDCETYETGSADPDDWVCPGDECLGCSVSAFRSCFNDPISISGTPDPANPILAGTFCLPPSTNGAVNSATGSPGPGTVQTDTLVDLRY